MVLYDPSRTPEVASADAVLIVHDFLQRCRRWAAEREIPARLQQVQADLDPQDAARLQQWIAYLRFTEHAIEELESGRLDHWFTDGDST